MTKISISKDHICQQEEPLLRRDGSDVKSYDFDKRINRVDIDMSRGLIEVYVDGELIKPKRDVFKMALDDWKQNFISSLPRDGSFEDWSESLSDYSARYDAGGD